MVNSISLLHYNLSSLLLHRSKYLFCEIVHIFLAQELLSWRKTMVLDNHYLEIRKEKHHGRRDKTSSGCLFW